MTRRQIIGSTLAQVACVIGIYTAAAMLPREGMGRDMVFIGALFGYGWGGIAWFGRRIQ